MGNSHVISEDKLIEAERKVLSFSGIPYDNFNIHNVVIDEDGNYMRTVEVGDVSESCF